MGERLIEKESAQSMAASDDRLRQESSQIPARRVRLATTHYAAFFREKACAELATSRQVFWLPDRPTS